MTQQSIPSIWKPLPDKDFTRILVLSPCEGERPLSGSIQVIHLSNTKNLPKYEALSYTWAPAIQTANSYILIHGHTISLRLNLWHALRRLRYVDRPRSLWIDALSICQSDVEEKNQQVNQISLIFAHAFRVLVWVGEHAHKSEELFRPWTTPYERSALHTYIRNSKDRFLSPRSRADDATRSGSVGRRMDIWLAFLNRPYWRRTWIIQEIVLPENILVCCGPDSMPWSQFFDDRFDVLKEGKWLDYRVEGIKVFHDRDRGNLSHLEHVLQLVQRRRRRRHEYLPIVQLMHELGVNSECEDPRDKIYALKSLSNEHFAADYNLSLAEIFIDLLSSPARPHLRLSEPTDQNGKKKPRHVIAAETLLAVFPLEPGSVEKIEQQLAMRCLASGQNPKRPEALDRDAFAKACENIEAATRESSSPRFMDRVGKYLAPDLERFREASGTLSTTEENTAESRLETEQRNGLTMV